MSTYFGFLPTDELNQKIDNTIDLVNNRPDEEFYPHQLDLTNQIAREIMDNLFGKLVVVIKDEKRREKMQKLVDTVHSSVDTMLKHIITKQDNKKVLKSFNFLLDDCLFQDNEDNRRVGFLLSDSDAKKLIENFEKSKEIDQPHELLQEAMDIIIETNLEHFLKEFSKHLHLGMLKRGAIPIAEKGINKTSQVAIHKLLPEMSNKACMRLVDHFEGFVVEK